MILTTAQVDSPIGTFSLFAHEGLLCQIGLAEEGEQLLAQLAARYGRFTLEEQPDPAGAATALGRYFAGDLRALDGLPVDPGGTPFFRSVWTALRRIPLGTTLSYSALAAVVGRPAAVRAVGMANARNPLPLVCPCHRVVRSDGDLCGFGLGIWRKRWLLQHEGALPEAQGVLAGVH